MNYGITVPTQRTIPRTNPSIFCSHTPACYMRTRVLILIAREITRAIGSSEVNSRAEVSVLSMRSVTD